MTPSKFFFFFADSSPWFKFASTNQSCFANTHDRAAAASKDRDVAAVPRFHAHLQISE
jgi:hypothetical protein